MEAAVRGLARGEFHPRPKESRSKAGNTYRISFQKTRMKRIALTLLALVSATSAFAQTADPSETDQPLLLPQPAQAQMKHSIWDRLNLTDDQKEKLKQIRETDRDSLASARAQVKIARESLHAALLANPENTADIQAKATNLATALDSKSLQLALHEAKVNQVLTPTQRVALDEANKNRMDQWHPRNWGLESGRRQRERPLEGQNQNPRPGRPAPSPGMTPEAPTN
jgi:Spy/CpxP family protein refolding chaperone